jgi:hypothetical protein
LLYALIGLVGLAAAAAFALNVALLWTLRDRTYDQGDAGFRALAVKSLTAEAGAVLPPQVRLTRYVVMPNFNDGSELWEMMVENEAVLSRMLPRLKLRRIGPNDNFPKLDESDSRVPAWVDRPKLDMKWLYRSDETQCPRHWCNPIDYFWSADGRTFYLYRITL